MKKLCKVLVNEIYVDEYKHPSFLLYMKSIKWNQMNLLPFHLCKVNSEGILPTENNLC